MMGHLLAVIPFVASLPEDAHQNYLMTDLSREFEESDGAFYLDMWPFISPLLVVTSPAMSIQACQQYDLEKPESVMGFFTAFAGGKDNMFALNGPDWKNLRSMFNP